MSFKWCEELNFDFIMSFGVCECARISVCVRVQGMLLAVVRTSSGVVVVVVAVTVTLHYTVVAVLLLPLLLFVWCDWMSEFHTNAVKIFWVFLLFSSPFAAATIYKCEMFVRFNCRKRFSQRMRKAHDMCACVSEWASEMEKYKIEWERAFQTQNAFMIN